MGLFGIVVNLGIFEIFWGFWDFGHCLDLSIVKTPTTTPKQHNTIQQKLGLTILTSAKLPKTILGNYLKQFLDRAIFGQSNFQTKQFSDKAIIGQRNFWTEEFFLQSNVCTKQFLYKAIFGQSNFQF